MVKGIIDFSHDMLKNVVTTGDIVVDATCGNGNDTLFLSRMVGSSGQVLAFDIQKQAIETTKNLLKDHDCTNVTLIQDSHANVDTYLDTDEISGAIFNLGYLPRSDKKVITKPATTLTAIQKLMTHLKKNGVIVLVIYYGHEGGLEEKMNVLDFVTTLDQKYFSVLKYQFINQRNNPPFVVVIQKKS